MCTCCLAAIRVGLRLAAQALEKSHGARGGSRHVELAHAREFGHFSCGHGAHHGIAMISASLECGQDGQEMIFHEQHGGNHNVALSDIGLAASQCFGIIAPLGCGVHAKCQTRHGFTQCLVCALSSTGQVAVHGDQHHAHCHWRDFSG